MPATGTAILDGRLLAPGDDGWDDARRVYDPGLDLRPEAIAVPRDAGDVARALRWARGRGLTVATLDPPVAPANATGHQMLERLTPEAIDRVLEAVTRGPLAMVQFRHLGGALHREPPGAGARATLPGEVSVFSLGVTEGPDAAAVRRALRAVDDALTAHRVPGYANFVEVPADARAFFDEATWRRLRAVKAAHDAQDVIRTNHHVPA